MVFILKHCDKAILRFSANEASSNPDYKILWVTDEKSLLPLGFELSEEGLSLNDVYWVVPEDFDGKFADYNLYDNRFNRILSQIVFTGYGSSVKSSLLSSPEFTTNGMLPKCWRRINGKIELYKGSTSGFSNNGFEAYSEYYAWQIAKVLKIDAVEYNLHFWKNTLCSTCELFTSKKYSFVPVGRLVTKGGFEAVYDGFIDTAKKVLTQEHKKNLKKLLNFKFKKHPKYNLDAIRLRKIEDQVQRNVMELLG